MKTLALIAALLLAPQKISKFDPSGVWVAETGSKYEMRLSGSDLHIQLVAGSNPKFLSYELDAKNESEVNTYSGKGFLVAKMDTGKECKLPTEWRFIVVAPDRILGNSSSVVADGNTCVVQETEQVRLDLKKDK
jgi:hypothetical protein